MTHSKIVVMDQTSIPGKEGQENCGVHAFKNSILFLLWQKMLITDATFKNLVKDKQFFEEINAVLKKNNMPVADIRPGQIINFHNLVRAGKFDFSNYGITQDNLNSLNLHRDGNQDITAFELVGYVGEPCFGLRGGSEDLLNAVAAAKFMRLKGEGTHVFAAGMSKGGQYGHWITAIVTKNLEGQLSWQFMDSWHNETVFSKNLITLIEKVLKKTEPQLQMYLIEVYDVCTDLLNRRYKAFFDVVNHTVIAGKKVDMDGKKNFCTAKQFYLEQNLEVYSKDLNEMYIFMKETGWLLSAGKEETIRKKQLYAIANFMYENINEAHDDLKEKLGFICKEVSESISRFENAEEEVNIPDITEPEEGAEIKFKKENYAHQLRLLELKITDIKTRMLLALGNGEASNHKKLRLAYDAASTLHAALTAEGEIYFKNPNRATYQKFKINCGKQIDIAREELSLHRGWAEFLANLALGLATLGLGILIKGAVNHAKHRHFLFVCKTRSEEELDDLVPCINSVAPVA